MPFGGKFRIIDFALSNCVNSGIRKICVLTQYKSQSLIHHIQRGWGFLRGEFDEFVELLPAQQQRERDSWYRGTADAVYQNLDIIRTMRPKHVLVLAGDHIYKMDYGPMIAAHVEKGADITVGVHRGAASRRRAASACMYVDATRRVVELRRKAREPEADAGPTDVALASMGIYVFNTQSCSSSCSRRRRRPDSAHDFGRNIIPDADRHAARVRLPVPRRAERTAQSYWRDVGTVDAYYEANMELIHVSTRS